MHDQLFDESMEDFADVARASAVKTEGKLIEIPLQVLFLNATLVGCAEPSFE